MDAVILLNIRMPLRSILTTTICLLSLFLSSASLAATMGQVNQYVEEQQAANPQCRIYTEEYFQTICWNKSLKGIRVYKDCNDAVVYKMKRFIVSDGKANKCLTYCGWLEIIRCSGLDSVGTHGYINVGEVYYGSILYEEERTYCSGRTATTSFPGLGSFMNQYRCLDYSGPVNNCPTVEPLRTFFPICSGDDPCCESCDPRCGSCPIGPSHTGV